MVRVVYFMSKC